MKLLSVIVLILLLNFYPGANEPNESIIPDPEFHLFLKEVEIVDTQLSELEKKWCLFRDLGKELPITITPEKFANACMIVFWCESNLNPKAVSGDQQGFQQLTASTRRKLRLPRNITHLSFEQQIPFLKKYLLATKLIHKVKTSVDLHVLNFAPARFNNHKLSSYIEGLDKDHDNIITRNDLYLFQKQRTKRSNIQYRL